MYLCIKYHVYYVGYYLLGFIVISSVHEAFSFSINVHALHVGTHNFLQGTSLRNFDTGIVIKLRFQNWEWKYCLIKILVFRFYQRQTMERLINVQETVGNSVQSSCKPLNSLKSAGIWNVFLRALETPWKW